jgi:hypothetical protein
MNKTLKILLVVALIAGVFYYFINRKPWTTLKSELKDFSVQDTASVYKVFIADKRGGKVTLNKTENKVWLVNNNIEADINKVNLLLSTLKDVQVLRPVAQNEFNSTIAFMSTEGIKVELYDKNNDIIKTIYVGTATPEQTGTFMLIEGSSTPFVCHIPGFVGYLTPRFFSHALAWQTKLVFRQTEKDISKVSLSYPQNPGDGFSVENGETPVLKDAKGQINPIEKGFAKYYLSGFANLFFEGYKEGLPAGFKDSVRHSTPYCVITLNDKNNTETKLYTYYKKVDSQTKQQEDEQGNPLIIDREKYWGFLNNDTNLFVMQKYNFGRLFKTLGEFNTSSK